MTCIVGIQEGGKVWIGGDSAAVGNNTIQVIDEEKVFQNGDVIVGYTTSFRMGQILQNHWSPPARLEGQHPDHYVKTTLIESIRDVLKSKGYAEVSSNQESGGKFLLGYKGTLYRVDNDYQVIKMRDKMTAVGSGEEFALGSLASTEGEPTERIEKALRAASRFNPYVREPFNVVCV